MSANKITTGSLRGINVQAGTFTTKGSYLTSAPGAGATSLDVADTTYFSSGGGSGVIIDTTTRCGFSGTGGMERSRNWLTSGTDCARPGEDLGVLNGNFLILDSATNGDPDVNVLY
jgi:hypothetical protein